MAYTAARTWTTGESPSASTLNTDIRDNMLAACGADKAAARVYKATAFNHNSTGNWLDMTFDSERYDTQALHSTSVNTNRLTIPASWGGLWMIGISMSWLPNATGGRFTRILLNGTTELAQQGAVTASAGLPTPLNVALRISVGCDGGE